MFLHMMIQAEGLAVLLVGAGPVAARKAAGLAAGGARLSLLAPERAEAHWQNIQCRWFRQEYSPEFSLAEYQLVIAATDNAGLNEEIARRCAREGIGCNCASGPEQGNVILPGTVQAGGFSAALYSGGRAPFLTKRLKGELADWLAAYDEETLSWLAGVRRQIITACAGQPERKKQLLSALGAVPLPQIKQKMQETAGNIGKQTGGDYGQDERQYAEDIIHWLQREQAGPDPN